MAAEVVAAAAPASRLLGAARLPDHRLAFTRRSVRTGTGVADVVPTPGDSVWGALYEIPAHEFEQLDRKEGAGWAYQLVSVRVECAGTPHDALTYEVITHDAEHVPPSDEYLGGLIAAAQALRLPPSYIGALEVVARAARLP